MKAEHLRQAIRAALPAVESLVDTCTYQEEHLYETLECDPEMSERYGEYVEAEENTMIAEQMLANMKDIIDDLEHFNEELGVTP